MVKLIWAEDRNKGIGNNGKLLWHIPEDLKFFKSITQDKTIVMGRKTYESLPHKPLPNRTNIVLSSGSSLISTHPNLVILSSIEEVLENYNDSWVIGGGSIYELFLPYATEAYITEVDYCAPKIDTFAPSIEQVNRYLKIDNEGEWVTSIKSLRFRINHYTKL